MYQEDTRSIWPNESQPELKAYLEYFQCDNWTDHNPNNFTQYSKDNQLARKGTMCRITGVTGMSYKPPVCTQH